MSTSSSGSPMPRAPTSGSPLPRTTTKAASPLPRAPPFWTSHYGSSPFPTNPTYWTTMSTGPWTRTSLFLTTNTEDNIITEPYPPTSTSEIISPTSFSSYTTTSSDSATTDNTSSTTEPYTTTTTTTTTTATPSTTVPTTTTTRWTYTITIVPTTTTTRWTYTTTRISTTSRGPIIPPTPAPTQDSERLSTGAIVGIAVGSVVGLIALTLASFLIRRRQRRAVERESVYYQNPPPMQENRFNNYGGGGGGGSSGGVGQDNINNNGTGLGITSNSTNAPYDGGDFRTSQDLMNTTGSLDTGGGYSSQSSGFGYDGLALGGVGPAVALGSGLHGYDNEYQSQHQSLRPQPQQSYYPSSQALSYTPPTEPDIAPEDRYDPTYAARREQEAAYMNYQQQQLYLQSQRQLQQQQKQQQYLAGQLSMPMPTIPPAPAGSLESQLNTYGTQDGYRPDNRFSAVSADSQTYLERLRGSYPPTGIEQGLISAEGGALGAAVMNARTPSPAMTPPMPVPPIGAGYPAGQQHILPSGQQQQQVLQSSPSFVDPAAYVAAGTAGSMTGSEDYAYPESDARRVPSNDRWASPPKPADSTLHPQAITVQPANPHSINNNEAATVGAASSTTQGELTPPMTNRFAEGEVTAAAAAGEVGSHGGVGSPGRSSVLSQASSTMSGLNPKRLNSPQLIPSPKRAPQVLHPEVEPTITMIPPRE